MLSSADRLQGGPSAGDVHTQRFAFGAQQVDDESVKMSNLTRRRTSTLCRRQGPASPAAHLQNHQFLFDTNEPLSISVTPGFATRTKQSTSVVLFDTNEPLSATSNSTTNTNQSTSLFLFDTNERSPITTPGHCKPCPRWSAAMKRSGRTELERENATPRKQLTVTDLKYFVRIVRIHIWSDAKRHPAR